MSTTDTPATAPRAQIVSPAQGAGTAASRTVGELTAAISRDASALVRVEMELAKAELRAEARAGALGGGLFAVAGVLGLLAVLMASVAFGLGLAATGLHPGWAFLIVAGVYLVVAGILALIGRGPVRRLGPPQRTIRTLKDVATALRSRDGQRPDATA